jgi:hypothetical protein
MSNTPAMADLALRLTQHHVLSAMPDAPVVEHRSRRRRPKARRLARTEVRARLRPQRARS